IRKGNRPSFDKCAKGELARDLYQKFIEKLNKENIPFQTGEFGADMKVSLTNDGPVTIIIDSRSE
ncbi:D-tyrosyl-tRNA(Tyr) deacylase, partial [Bacteroides ovatus]